MTKNVREDANIVMAIKLAAHLLRQGMQPDVVNKTIQQFHGYPLSGLMKGHHGSQEDRDEILSALRIYEEDDDIERIIDNAYAIIKKVEGQTEFIWAENRSGAAPLRLSVADFKVLVETAWKYTDL